MIDFQRGSRGSHHKNRVVYPTSLQSDLPCVIPRTGMFLKGRIVILVYDHKPQVGNRRKHGASCSDNDPFFTAQQFVVCLELFGGLECGMEHG